MAASDHSALPLVSIITPSFNQGRFLESTIRSVLDLDYPRVEYLVIDGGSSDETTAIIQKYAAHLSYWVSEPDRGQAHAINKGLRRARGDILGWLNSDDLLLPDAVSRAADVFQREPQIDVVYSRLERINQAGERIPTPTLPKDTLEFSLKELLGECIVNQPGAFWRRSIMSRAGLLDESLQYAMDYEYWARLALEGAQFRRLPQVSARFRLSPTSKTVAHASEHAQEQLAVLAGLSTRPDLPELMGLNRSQLSRRTKKTRAVFCLQAFYGELKRACWRDAIGWLATALQSDPTVIFKRRWLDLWLSRLRRPPG